MGRELLCEPLFPVFTEFIHVGLGDLCERADDAGMLGRIVVEDFGLGDGEGDTVEDAVLDERDDQRAEERAERGAASADEAAPPTTAAAIAVSS